MNSTPSNVTQLLVNWNNGDPSALNQLLPLVNDELRRLARNYLRRLTDLVIVVRGGAGALPPPGTIFSGAVGETVEDAAAYVPHGTIRFTTIGAILAAVGSVTLQLEITRSGKINMRHVNVMESSSPSTFSEPLPNPVPKQDRLQ